MENYKKIIYELNELPVGYVSEKIISGNKYYYYQENHGSKVSSKYIKKEDKDALIGQIERRREIEKELKAIEDSIRPLKTPSKRAYALTGDLMMRDVPVAGFEEGKLLWRDEDKCPLLIKRTGDVASFLRSRAIDRDRAHSRALKRFLGIREDDDAFVSLHSYGACITDNYWFRPKGSKIKYEDISFTSDIYSDLALKGDVSFIPRSPKFTPELTLGGSYEKCWKLIDGRWYLYKKGNDKEIYSEIFCAGFAKMLGIPSAVYEFADGFIRTENFASELNLEPVSSIAGDDDRYENVFESLLSLSEDLAKDYLRLVIFDFIVNNVDRHNENCGIMRNNKSGKIISLAPNYDNNMALLSAVSNLVFNEKRDGHLNYLKKFIEGSVKAKELLAKISLPRLSRDDIKGLCMIIPFNEDAEAVTSYVYKRYEYIKRYMETIQEREMK